MIRGYAIGIAMSATFYLAFVIGLICGIAYLFVFPHATLHMKIAMSLTCLCPVAKYFVIRNTQNWKNYSINPKPMLIIDIIITSLVGISFGLSTSLLSMGYWVLNIQIIAYFYLLWSYFLYIAILVRNTRILWNLQSFLGNNFKEADNSNLLISWIFLRFIIKIYQHYITTLIILFQYYLNLFLLTKIKWNIWVISYFLFYYSKLLPLIKLAAILHLFSSSSLKFSKQFKKLGEIFGLKFSLIKDIGITMFGLELCFYLNTGLNLKVFLY